MLVLWPIRGYTAFRGTTNLLSRGYDPEGAEEWLREIEKIFSVITCEENQKALFAAYVLTEEAEDWWENTRPRLEGVGGAAIPWATFRQAFLEKYFPEDVRTKKEMEFLELKHGGMMVAEYAAKFERLVHYCPQYHGEAEERSKCVKFMNGLRPEIKMAVNYKGVYNFVQLTNMCQVYDEDQRAKTTFYRSASAGFGKERKQSAAPSRPKPYSAPVGRYGNRFGGG